MKITEDVLLNYGAALMNRLRTGRGGPFESLDEALAEAKKIGYGDPVPVKRTRDTKPESVPEPVATPEPEPEVVSSST